MGEMTEHEKLIEFGQRLATAGAQAHADLARVGQEYLTAMYEAGVGPMLRAIQRTYGVDPAGPSGVEGETGGGGR